MSVGPIGEPQGNSQAEVKGRLAAVRVAVTRSHDQAPRLSELLSAQGAQVLEVPLIQFAPSSLPAAVQACLPQLAQLDWLLLTSPQAVTALVQELRRLGLDMQALDKVKVAVVGASTARRLADYGLRAQFIPTQAGANFLAAQLPIRPGQRAVHLTSQLADAVLEEGLRLRGVALERLELYRTETVILSPEQRNALADVHAVTLASGSAARQLAALGFAHLPVAVLGPKTAQAAQEAGFGRVAQAAEISLEGLVEAVVQVVQMTGYT